MKQLLETPFLWKVSVAITILKLISSLLSPSLTEDINPYELRKVLPWKKRFNMLSHNSVETSLHGQKEEKI